jgi:hypothetical protein
MPFVSQAQRAYFYSNPKLKKYIPEFEAATGKKKLPKHKKGAKKRLMR